MILVLYLIIVVALVANRLDNAERMIGAYKNLYIRQQASFSQPYHTAAATTLRFVSCT